MGTEINNEGNENEKINEDDIIENDCYEEIDMRKINQIIEKEKNWNNNTIIYSNNLINISNIDIENENNQKQNPKQKEENIKEKIEPKEKDDKEKEKETDKDEKRIEKEDKENKKKESLKNSNINNNIPKKNKLHSKPKIKPKNTSDDVLNHEKESTRKNNINKYNNHDNNKIIEKNEQENDYNIQNIIPKFKLLKLKEDEIIYSGTLEKILNVPESKKLAYTKRFCVLTKKYFAYYKSKESFVSLNKPMFVIENTDIIRTESTFLDGDGYFGIVCEVNDRTKNLIYRVNSFVTKDENNSQLLLGFRSNNYEEMTKWLILLNYFISEKNNNA